MCCHLQVASPPTAPLVLAPHLAQRPWGGSRLGPGIGEAWDLSVHPNGPSMVVGGPYDGLSLPQVVSTHPEAFGGGIDLLAKRLDCAQNLSVQVHPRDTDPKTEAWVVLEAEAGSGVYHGLSGDLSAAELRSASLDGSVVDHLRFVPLSRGQVVFVPAGTVHAIGGGLLLFELQQSSDTTYRLYDWGRDREMHLDEGVAVADLGPAGEVAPAAEGTRRLIGCDYFWIDWLELEDSSVLDPGRTWVAATVLAGAVRVAELAVEEGRTVLVPTTAGPVELTPATGPATLLRYGPGGPTPRPE